MKITIVAPVHIYDDVRVFQKEAKTLAANGHRVSLIARIAEPQFQGDIQIIPAPTAASRIKRFLLLFRVFRIALTQRADVYHLHNPDTIPIVFGLKLLRKRVIYDTHENFRDFILIKHWIPRPLRLLFALMVSGLEAVAGRVADRSIATEAAVVKRLGRNAVLIENPPVTESVAAERACPCAREVGGELRLIYVGTISRARGLDLMIDALEVVNRQQPCRLWLIGGGADKEIDEARQRPGWKWVDYLGMLPQAQAFAYMMKSEIGLVTFLNVGGHAHLSPNKLYEYMLFGIPFVASDFAAWRRHMPSLEAGLFADPSSIDDVAEKIIWLAQHPEAGERMAAQGKQFVMQKYNWELESRKLLDIYQTFEDQALTHA
ncbi:MAG TPA: glycosyltransferase [Pyrinomonadaceae bacterium]|jgi:glycosyltransferase involved in cell wall biosynthesis|nr:glycosyltransferase [Pyrinomonadaceae bacterium]